MVTSITACFGGTPEVWITPKNSYTSAAIEFCKIRKEKTRTQEPAESESGHNDSGISLALST